MERNGTWDVILYIYMYIHTFQFHHVFLHVLRLTRYEELKVDMKSYEKI